MHKLPVVAEVCAVDGEPAARPLLHGQLAGFERDEPDSAVGAEVGAKAVVGRTVPRSAAVVYHTHPLGVLPTPGSDPSATGQEKSVAGCAFPDASTTSIPDTRAVAVPNCTTPATPRST